MRAVFIGLVAVAMLSEARAVGVADRPAAQCDSGHAIMAVYSSALDSSVATGKLVVARVNALQALVKKHPEARQDRPIKEALTKDEVDEFERVSGQIAVANMNLLAESRRERDMEVLQRMVDAVDKVRTDGAQVAKDPRYTNTLAYVFAISEAMGGSEHPTARDDGTCSIDLALQRDSVRVWKKYSEDLQGSSEYLQMLGLRAKYNLRKGETIDPKAMDARDAARLSVLQKTVGESFANMKAYDTAMSAIQYFADMSEILYDEQRREVLQLGGTSDGSEYERMRSERFNRLSKQMQTVWKIWMYVDDKEPCQQIRMMEQAKKTGQDQQPRK